MPSLTEQTFNCSVCLEDIPKTSKPVNVAGDDVCQDCFDKEIKPKFYAALKHEKDFPVTWGSAVLGPERFNDQFGGVFKVRWWAKRQEYKTPFAERVYCIHKTLTKTDARRDVADEVEECGWFLGTKVETKYKTLTCLKCSGQTCGTCSEPLPAEGDKPHHCMVPIAGEESKEEDPFQGMILGKDYQRCPSCKVVVALVDGCNTIVCEMPSCRVHFCFICGQEAHHDSDHWKAGNECPRWNQPGAANAHYDAPPRNMPVLLQEAADDAREAAAAATTEEYRIMMSDTALLWEVSAQAYREIAEANQRNDVEAPLTPLMNANVFLLVCMGLWDVKHPAQINPNHGVQLGRSIQGLRNAHDAVLHWKNQAAPAVLERYPAFSKVFERYSEMAARRFVELEAMLAAQEQDGAAAN